MSTRTETTTPITKGEYASHHSITDFYPESSLRLKLLLKNTKPFDTGWFGCKKEIRSARVARFDGGSILLNVSASMDDGDDLVDTLIWEASGGNDFAASGWDAMDKAGLETGEVKERFKGELMDELESAELVFGENEEIATKQLDIKRVTFKRICDELGILEDQVEQELDRRYKAALELVKTRIENHRAYERSLV